MRPTFTLASPETGTTYHLYVEAPRVSHAVPAVFFLDGDNQFSAAVAAYRVLRRQNEIPPLLLVGVGYGASYGQPANRRARDYSPVKHPGIPEGGGAEAFLRFLTRTLTRELRRRYRVDSERSGIAGHSLGSLLVLHALFSASAPFTRYLASAPSIWWGKGAILRLAAKRRAQRARLPAKLFLGVGGKDSVSMRVDLGRLLTQLADKPFADLDATFRGFPRHTHYNVLRVAFAAGLKTLFG